MTRAPIRRHRAMRSAGFTTRINDTILIISIHTKCTATVWVSMPEEKSHAWGLIRVQRMASQHTENAWRQR